MEYARERPASATISAELATDFSPWLQWQGLLERRFHAVADAKSVSVLHHFTHTNHKTPPLPLGGLQIIDTAIDRHRRKQDVGICSSSHMPSNDGRAEKRNVASSGLDGPLNARCDAGKSSGLTLA